MFEKETEETFRKNYTEYCCGKELLSPYWDLWQDGAEFGYNKANEWHFVKDGKYPKNNKLCLLYLGSCYKPTMGWFENNVWCFEDDRVANVWQDEVIAWKEIVLPELKESEKEKA